MWEKVKTGLTVLILSCLIWIFAERAVTKQAVIDYVKISLVSPPDVLAEFTGKIGNFGTPANNNRPVTSDSANNTNRIGSAAGAAEAVGANRANMTTGAGGWATSRKLSLLVSGPARRIQQALEGKLNNTILLDTKDISQSLKPGESKEFDIDVLTQMKKRITFTDIDTFLQVLAVKPATLHIKVTKLVRKSIPVKVFDQNGSPLAVEKVEPASQEAYVMAGSSPVIKVYLDYSQQLAAANRAIKVSGSVLLPRYREPRKVDVVVKLAEDKTTQTVETIRNPRLGVMMPMSMQGKYKVVIDDKDKTQLDEYNPIECRGDPEAVSRYRESDIQLVLKINESDIANSSGVFNRPLIYYFPQDAGKIEIIDPQQTPIRFHLVKITQSQPAG